MSLARRWACAVLGAVLVPWTSQAAEPPGRQPLRSVGSWHYQLQAIDADKLAQHDVDLLVIDGLGEPENPVTADLVTRLKRRPDGRTRLVLAYLSIGEAESYRAYWQRTWEKAKTRPAWLMRRNPSWPDNYPVRYWNPEWQELTMGLVTQVMAHGFDGLYLDRVDVADEVERGGPALADRRARMVAFVDRIARQARSARPESVVVAQNGLPLAGERGYLDVIDGVAIEDLLCAGTGRLVPRAAQRALSLLEPAVARRVPLLSVDYLSHPKARARYVADARKHGLVPFCAASRRLDRIP